MEATKQKFFICNFTNRAKFCPCTCTARNGGNKVFIWLKNQEGKLKNHEAN
jgi:hypothetical protein